MRTMMLAQGKSLALLAALMERGGIVPAQEFGDLLGLLAVIEAETDPEQSSILAHWAATVRDAAQALRSSDSSDR